MENDQLIEAIEELGLEGAFCFFGDFFLHRIEVSFVGCHRIEAKCALTFDGRGADVGGEDDDGIAEVDLAAHGVGDHAFFEDLKQQVHDIGVGFFDFVKKDHTVRAAADLFRKLTTFFIADVARRRADETAGGEFFHVFRHVDLDQRFRISKHELGEIASKVGFANACRAEEKERADGATWVLEVGTGATQCLGNRAHGFVLADDACLQLVFHLEQLLGLGFLHAAEWHTSPLRDNGHDVFVIDLDDRFLGLCAPSLQGIFEVFLGIFFFIAHGSGFLEVLLGDGGEFVAIDLLDFRFQFFDHGWASHLGNTSTRARFIENIDGFVGQIASREIACSQFH